MEYMESFEECAVREVREETGIEIANVRFLRLLNLKTYVPHHYVDVGLVADWKAGRPRSLARASSCGMLGLVRHRQVAGTALCYNSNLH